MFSENDNKFMAEALAEAKLAFENEEVPVGAVLVKDDVIIARGHNQVESKSDATLHAEVVCIREGAKVLGDWRLLDTTLYVTLEPCSMCAGAAILSRVPRIIWGCPDIRHGACGSWTDLFQNQHPIHQISIQHGLMEDESRFLLKEFFRKRRKEKSGSLC